MPCNVWRFDRNSNVCYLMKVAYVVLPDVDNPRDPGVRIGASIDLEELCRDIFG